MPALGLGATHSLARSSSDLVSRCECYCNNRVSLRCAIGTTHYLSIRTDNDGSIKISKLWKEVRERDFDAPELRWEYPSKEDIALTYNLHWRKASYDRPDILARLLSKCGATGQVSMVEWDWDLSEEQRAAGTVSYLHIPKQEWHQFTASAKHNQFTKNELEARGKKHRD